MKILYDFRAFQIYYQRGIARYVQDLFESAIRQHGEKGYVLLYKDKPYPKFPEEIQEKTVMLFFEDFLQGMHERKTFDIYINGSALLLNLPVKKAVSDLYPVQVLNKCYIKTSIVYDFIPLFFQEYIPTPETKKSYILQIDALKGLDHIFTDSMCTMALSMMYTGRGAESFTCLYGGADIGRFSTKKSDEPYCAETRKNHLIYVSGAAVQKNNEGFTQAFCKAYRRGQIPRDSKLYIVCKTSKNYTEMIRTITERNGCQYPKQVEATGFIPDEEMISLLQTARSAVFPSYCEGLGLPILESYAAGTPCWSSNFSATKEITLPECTFDPFDEGSMISTVEKIYRSPELCEKSLTFGRKLLKRVNWKNAGKILLNKFENLLRNFSTSVSNCPVEKIVNIPKVNREDVINCYRYILGREPESEEVIKRHMQSNQNFCDLRTSFLKGSEFDMGFSTIKKGD